ncbi:hypothetical protein CkaCkLH20_08188 [Colletotrichum karsti]|uniref:MYND-type domain-containing protein n=1 Tax=Colletotrichum karsti TaxID=1095194 RepID=A0A9P6I1P8_9PEZI|nr:uncharacterized protein CkaCkLH20_08188 [Colletotrichum karsti]KAF9874205.1 hypothetical protein CkaCkLH20_08188 [Colletotrichum karsti]
MPQIPHRQSTNLAQLEMAGTRMAEGLCIACKRQWTSRNCAYCGYDFVCSRDCEEKMMFWDGHREHVLACRELCRRRPKTTARTMFAAFRGCRSPTDPRTAKDFGFDRCLSNRDSVLLRSVYITLVNNIGVSERELDMWVREKTLYANIKAEFEAQPHKVRPPYLA